MYFRISCTVFIEILLLCVVSTCSCDTAGSSLMDDGEGLIATSRNPPKCLFLI